MTGIRQYRSVAAASAGMADYYFPFSHIGVGAGRQSVVRHDYFGDWKVSNKSTPDKADASGRCSFSISEIYY